MVTSSLKFDCSTEVVSICLARFCIKDKLIKATLAVVVPSTPKSNTCYNRILLIKFQLKLKKHHK